MTKLPYFEAPDGEGATVQLFIRLCEEGVAAPLWACRPRTEEPAVDYEITGVTVHGGSGNYYPGAILSIMRGRGAFQ